MSKLSIFDIVALAKAGFKAQDIEKYTSIDIPDDDKKKDEEQEKETPAAGSQPPAENGAKETPKDKEGEKEEEPDIDYKKLYEEKCAELENVQKMNTRTEQPEVKTTSLDDIVRSFM